MPVIEVNNIAEVKHGSGKYFVSILVETKVWLLPKTNRAVGNDLGVKTFCDSFRLKNDSF